MVGRTAERDRVDALLAAARAGTSGALVILGAAGIGKTALLDTAAEAADGMRVLRGAGIDSEAELPFAGLHLLLHPYLDRLSALPAPQAAALRTAFGLAEPSDTSRFLVGAATLSLLSELAADRPLVCLLDDAQWLDRASIDALLFAVRRLHTDPIATIFTVRDDDRPFRAPDVEVLRLEALNRPEAEALLRRLTDRLTEPQCNRILAEAAGHPLALVELAATVKQWRAGPPSPVAPLPASGRLQRRYQQQIRSLPDATRMLLLLAAADDTADSAHVRPAARSLGLSMADLEPAEHAGLVRVTESSVLFRHPLVRAAAYQGAPHARRLAAHRALAEAVTGDADRRAWHLAAAADGPDESVAAELEAAAGRAEMRGGSASVLSALQRAALLSGDDERKARRLVGAARAAYDAGWADRAADLAEAGAALTADPRDRADAVWIRAQVAYERTSPAVAAAGALDAADLVIDIDPARAVPMLIEAVWCARDAGDLDVLRRCADRLAGAAPKVAADLRPPLDALAALARFLDGDVHSTLGPMRAWQRSDPDGYVERLTTGFMGLLMADDRAATEVLEGHVAEIRARGAIGWLPYALEPLSHAYLLTGRFRDAEASVTEALALAEDMGQPTQVLVLTSIDAWLAGVTGDEDRCRSAAGHVLANADRHPVAGAFAEWALGLLDLDEHRLDTACAGHDLLIRAVADHVEAAVRAGHVESAAKHLPRLAAWATHTAAPVAGALLARCHGLLGDAEADFVTALELHATADGAFDEARTRLVYGEWLRRRRRRSDARVQLTDALATFERLRAARWAARACGELAALGLPAPELSRPADTAGQLTPQELQVVRLAAAGLSNREIGGQLFISPRTVGYHLYKAYPKLGVARRMELSRIDL